MWTALPSISIPVPVEKIFHQVRSYDYSTICIIISLINSQTFSFGDKTAQKKPGKRR